MEPSDKIKQIESISKFELFSIVYLCECLTDDSLEVRYSAYQKLRSTNLDPKILSDRQIDRDNDDAICDYGKRQDRLHEYATEVLEKLTVREHYELIDKIYGSLFGRLAYLHKETVRETTYFIP